MKTISRFILLIVTLLASYSCNDKKDGDWDDNIQLSAKTFEFSALSDSVTIKTGGTTWWISDIAVNGNFFYDFKDIDMQSYKYSIKQDCFVVERRDKNTLFIKVAENPNNYQRMISVGLQAGDYFDRVVIHQKHKP
jgi:hypothetical protein